MVDDEGRLYFLPPDWNMTFDKFRKALTDSNLKARAPILVHLLRNARSDDVFFLVSPQELREMWSLLEGRLGRQESFWSWIMESLEELGLA